MKEKEEKEKISLETEQRMDTRHGQLRAFPKLGALKKSHWNGGRICVCLYVCQVDGGPAWLFDMQRTVIWLQAWQRGRHRSCPSAQSWRIESVPATLTSLWVTSIPQSSNASEGPLRSQQEGQIAVSPLFRQMPQPRLSTLSEITGTGFSEVLNKY